MFLVGIWYPSVNSSINSSFMFRVRYIYLYNYLSVFYIILWVSGSIFKFIWSVFVILITTNNKWVQKPRRDNKWRRHCLQYHLVIILCCRHGQRPSQLYGPTFVLKICKKRQCCRIRIAPSKRIVVYN